MDIDKSWMEIDNRKDPIYMEGVETFLNYAFHLLRFRIMTTYTVWHVHGESPNEEHGVNEGLNDNDNDNDPDDDDDDDDDDMVGLVNRIYGVNHESPVHNDFGSDSIPGEPKGDAGEFYRLLNEAKKELHSGCELSKLATIVKYLVGIDTIFNRNLRNFDGIDKNGRDIELEVFKKVPLRKGDIKFLTDDWKHKAHLYILSNCKEVWPYVEKYKNSLPIMSTTEFRKLYDAKFPKWFHDRVYELKKHSRVYNDLLNLAFGPYPLYKCHSGHIVNGYRFHSMSRQMNRKSQNSGILSRGDYSSCEKEYYGTLTDVWEIQYPTCYRGSST
ncbi:hypothetical protein M5689_013116 [Euphorbia peplus]|nr:hypothetical protein M5689_013116 [Euphorbia peplus]